MNRLDTTPQDIKEKYQSRIDRIEKNINDNTKVKFLMAFIKNRNDKLDLLTVGLVNFSDIQSVEEDKKYWQIICEYNNNYLNNFMKAHSYQFFVPFSKPTYTFDDNIVEICYYHDVHKYELMQTNNPDIFYVSASGLDKLEEWYIYHYRIRPPFETKHHILSCMFTH